MDISIDEKRLSLYNGELQFVDGLNQIKQNLQIALNTLKAEWILDKSKGINYTEDLRYTDFLENDTKKQILEVKDVKSLENFSIANDKNSGKILVTASIKTAFGDINLEENIEI